MKEAKSRHIGMRYVMCEDRSTEREIRPWGSFEILLETVEYKIKRIIVAPQKRLSLQRHRYRSEHWFFLKGKALVTLDEREISLTSGGAVDIPCGSLHRVKNDGMEDVVFVEVQRGTYFGEDDVERFEDDFGRV